MGYRQFGSGYKCILQSDADFAGLQLDTGYLESRFNSLVGLGIKTETMSVASVNKFYFEDAAYYCFTKR